MAIIVKSLANGKFDSASSFANIYPPSGTTTRPALVKNMRFVNRSDSSDATLTLQLTSASTSKQISPAVTVPAKGLYVENVEITLGIGDVIKAKGSAFDFVVSGIEREV